MIDPLVSIIVPVYNAQEYLAQCVSSLTKQTYYNLEIILIDDGSTDNSLDICNSLANTDDRIRVISKKNEGAGLTRNVGLKQSSGQYITFLDSDDILREDAISKCIQIVKSYKCEFITYGTRVVNSELEELYKSVPKSNKKFYIKDEVRELFLADRISNGKETENGTNLQCAACMSCFYNNQLLKSIGWEFASEREVFSEDFYSQLRLFKHINSVYVLEDDLYFYRQNNKSLSHNERVSNYPLIKEFYYACLSIAEECSYSDTVKNRLIEPFISYSIVCLKYISKNCELKTSYKKIRKIISDETLLDAITKKDMSRDGIKRKISYFLIRNRCTLLTVLLMKFS